MPDTPTPPSLSYKDAGVDIDAGNQLVERIKSVASRSRRPEVLTGLGGFGALFELPSGYKEPVLVSGTDGVGTKLRLAMDANNHSSIGIDLVAMCVNDLIVGGAEPLFFLDYYATGKLDVDVAAQVVDSIGKGCELSGCSLVGGETAEMPGMYEGGDYDLAGFCVGIVEKSKIIDGSRVKAGDKIIALSSSGPHSNGYSLIRKVIDHSQAKLSDTLDGKTLEQHLLEPTRIYVKPLLELFRDSAFDENPARALAHITGGGLTENLPRVLPDDCSALIDCNAWQRPAIFNWLQQQGNIDTQEMLLTFNCGVGMLIVVSPEDEQTCLTQLTQYGETPQVIGEIQTRSSQDAPQVAYQNLNDF